jgi:hypothetical protein
LPGPRFENVLPVCHVVLFNEYWYGVDPFNIEIVIDPLDAPLQLTSVFDTVAFKLIAGFKTTAYMRAHPLASLILMLWVPFVKPVKILLVCCGPPFIEYEYGAVPEVVVTVIDPLLDPEHVGGAVTKVAVTPISCVITTVADPVQPIASLAAIV